MTEKKAATRPTKKKAPPAKAAPRTPRTITYAPDSPKAIAFCQAFVKSLNQTKAAEQAGYAKTRARQAGSDLMQLPEIQARIRTLLEERAKRTEIEADDVLKRFWTIATADANELVEHRRTACRHCYGHGHQHQRTQRERDEAFATWEASVASYKALVPELQSRAKKPSETFDEKGGIGWDPRKDPHPACTECFGEGISRAFWKDTRKLSDAGRALYAGVKETKDGFEFKMHNQMDALSSVARHLGMFKETLQLEAGSSLEAILAASWGAAKANGQASSSSAAGHA